MMLSKKNSETLENFSEKLEVEGRSLWQDARRRFMHNRAAVASLIVLVLIALFVILAPMLSQFAYDDTDWAMMSSAPDMESGHYFGTDSSGRDLLVRVAIGGRISLMVGVAAALVAVVVGTLYGSLSGYLGGKVDSVMMRLLEILNSFPFMFFVILLVTFFGQNILLIFGSRASRKPSPIKLKQNSVTTRNPAGNNSNHGETSIEFAPSLSNAPQLLNGSCVPNPRKLRKDSKRIMLGTRSDA